MVSFTSQIKSKCLSNLVRLDTHTHTQTAKEAAPHHPSYISRNCASTMMKTEWSFKLSCVLPCLMADLLLSYEVFDFCFLNTELSSSQNDVSGGLLSVSDNLRMSQFPYSTQKSLSDTEINRSSHVSSCKNKMYMPE